VTIICTVGMDGWKRDRRGERACVCRERGFSFKYTVGQASRLVAPCRQIYLHTGRGTLKETAKDGGERKKVGENETHASHRRTVQTKHTDTHTRHTRTRTQTHRHSSRPKESVIAQRIKKKSK
jgi:hypothetical protein